MKLFTYIYLILIIISYNIYSNSNGKANPHSDHSSHNHSQQKATLIKEENNKIVIKVNGMVCAFCAQGIEKNFNKRSEVKSTKVNLDTMEVSIELKEGKKLSEETLKKIVTGAGFSYVGRKK